MSHQTTSAWTAKHSAVDLINAYPQLLEFFDAMGIDDCCQELSLETIATHQGIGIEELTRRLDRELQKSGIRFTLR